MAIDGRLVIEYGPPDRFKTYAQNARTHDEAQLQQIRASVGEFGFVNPLLVDEADELIAGHARQEVALDMALAEVPFIVLRGLSPAQKRALRLADNRIALNAGWDYQLLAAELSDLEGLEALTGFTMEELQQLTSAVGTTLSNGGGGGGVSPEVARRTLAERFGLPPFSVLNAREGWWQERKRAWVGLGIQSELGRGDDLLGLDEASRRGATAYQRQGSTLADYHRSLSMANGMRDWVNGQGFSGLAGGLPNTSIFDPVLCELCYRWFCPPGGLVLDPFAGGSVRGIVASKLGRRYVGVDLSAPQLAANRVQASEICDGPEPRPAWLEGDSRAIGSLLSGTTADFLFTCPPYADLEVYSDDPADISTLPYVDFRLALAEIFRAAAALLKPDRFAAVVVGEARGDDGNYYGLVPDTIAAMQAAGLEYYNEAILVTAVGSLPVRAGRYFAATRKLGKTHQNLLVFVKGDPVAATQAIGTVDFGHGVDAAEFGEQLRDDGEQGSEEA